MGLKERIFTWTFNHKIGRMATRDVFVTTKDTRYDYTSGMGPVFNWIILTPDWWSVLTFFFKEILRWHST